MINTLGNNVSIFLQRFLGIYMLMCDDAVLSEKKVAVYNYK